MVEKGRQRINIPFSSGWVSCTSQQAALIRSVCSDRSTYFVRLGGMETRTKKRSDRIVQLNLCMHRRNRSSSQIVSKIYDFQFWCSPRVLNRNHERFVHIPEVCVVPLPVNSSGANTSAGRDSPSKAPNWGSCGQFFRSLE